jgi:hypothetical protein
MTVFTTATTTSFNVLSSSSLIISLPFEAT